MAAVDASDSSVLTSSSTLLNWWNSSEPHHSTALWNDLHNPWNPNSNPNSTSSSEDDISITSFTNTSNHSALTIESQELVESTSHMDFSGQPTSENHIWNQVLISVARNGGLHNSYDDGENLLEAFSTKSLSTEMFEPACDYLNKLESCWEITNPISFNSIEKKLGTSLIGNERLRNLSDVVSNWSLAPPDQQVDISLGSLINRYQEPSSYSFGEAAENTNSGYFPCFRDDLKGESQQQDLETSENSFLRSFTGVSDVPWSSTRNFSDLISFGGCLNMPLMDFQGSKPCLKASKLQGYKENVRESSSLVRANGRVAGLTGERKKKRSDDKSEILLKKQKHESSLKIPRVKLGDRITTLQQLVSPFGKTDTASVLLETIGYVRFLQDQVQVLSNPYMKSSSTKQEEHNPWGSGLERKEKTEAKFDLKSRGLCLVPVSCTPQVYRENGGVDYWTPTYRGCLYR